MISRTALMLVLLAALAPAGRAQQADLANLLTTAESSNFQSTSTHDDVVRFMRAVADASPLVHYTTYGTTYEGREMPLAVVGTGLADASAASEIGRAHV